MLNKKIPIIPFFIVTTIIYFLSKIIGQREAAILLYGTGTFISFCLFLSNCLKSSRNSLNPSKIFLISMFLTLTILSGFLLFQAINSNVYQLGTIK